jgi:hypothetical protein
MITYEQKTAKQFQELLAGIDNLWFEFPELIMLKYKQVSLLVSEGEYGFYIVSRDKKTSLFVGLWMEYWVDKGIPCAIVLDSAHIDNLNGIKEFKKIQSEFPEYFEELHNYQGYIVMAVKEYFIYNLDFHETVVKRIIEFTSKSGYFK